MTRPPLRPALVLAFTWLLAAVVLSMLLAPSLGARGLMWLGFHNVLCVIGCAWVPTTKMTMLRGGTGTAIGLGGSSASAPKKDGVLPRPCRSAGQRDQGARPRMA